MSLNSNTIGLEEILASVNALPEAGSGGGELQYETGTLTCSHTSGIGTYATLSGLPFVPKQVMVYESTSSGNLSAGSYGPKRFIYIQSGLLNYCRYAEENTTSIIFLYQDISGQYFSLSLTEDGFLFEGKHSQSTIISKLKYIVIG